MSEEQWLSYIDLGKRMKVKPETARRASDRARLAKRKGNDGKQEVLVDLNDPRFDGSLARRKTKNSARASVLKPQDSPSVLCLMSDLEEARETLHKTETALQVSEAKRAEKEEQIELLKDHIETLKNRPRRLWFWTR